MEGPGNGPFCFSMDRTCHRRNTAHSESRAAMDVNQMDPAIRAPSARAGFAQGKLEAARLSAL